MHNGQSRRVDIVAEIYDLGVKGPFERTRGRDGMESLWREKWSFEMPLRCSLPASSLRWQMLDIAVHRFLVPERLHSPTYRTEISREDALNIFRHPALSQTSTLYDFNII